MIGAIGFKKILAIVILLVVAGGLAYANFQVLRPQAEDLAGKVQSARNEESMLRSEIETMRTGMDKFKSQQLLFAKIEQEGFFNLQDRVAAREALNALQRDSKIIALRYEIRSASMNMIEGFTDKEYALLISPLTMQIDALDDLDVYKFISPLIYGFPGIVNIKTLSIESNGKLTTDILKNLSAGEIKALVTAKLEAEWITAAPHGTAPWADDFDPALLPSEVGE